jgi:hypothetical protein
MVSLHSYPKYMALCAATERWIFFVNKGIFLNMLTYNERNKIVRYREALVEKAGISPVDTELLLLLKFGL